MAGLNPIQPYEPPESDPYWNDVLWLLKGEGASGGFNSTVRDLSSRAYTLTVNGIQNFTYSDYIPTAAQGNHSPFNDPSTGSFQSGWASTYWTISGGDPNDFVFSKDYTIECWIKPFRREPTYPTSGAGLDFEIFAHGFTGSPLYDRYGTALYITSTGGIGWSWFDNTPWTITNKAKVWPGFLTDADKFTWVHVAVTRKNNIVRIFKNGQVFASWYDRGYLSMRAVGLETSAPSLRYGQTVITYDYLPPRWDIQNGSNPAVYFDGNGDYIQHNFSIPNPALNDFTIEGYFSVDPDALVDACVFTTNTSTLRISMHVGGGLLRVFSGQTTAALSSPRISYPIGQNVWYHFALVKSGITLLLFLNGTLVGTWDGTAADSFPTAATCTYRVALGSGTTTYFKGYMCGFRAVNGYALYLSNFTPPTTPPGNIPGTQILLNILPTPIGSNNSGDILYGTNTAYPRFGAGANAPSTSGIQGYITNFRAINGTCIYENNFTVPTSKLEDIENTVLLLRFEDFDLVNSTRKFNVAIKSTDRTSAIPNDSPYLCISSSTSKFGSSSIYFDCTTNGSPILPDNNFVYSGGYSAAGLNSSVDPLALGAGAFTIDFWIYPTVSVNRNCVIYDYNINNYNSSEFLIYINMVTMKPIVYISGFLGQNETGTTISANPFTGTCPVAIAFNTWTHVALTRDATGLNYNWVINGVSAGISYPTGFIGSANSQIVRNISKAGTFRFSSNSSPLSSIGGSTIGGGSNITSLSGLIATYLDEFRITRNVVRDFSPVTNTQQEITTFSQSFNSQNQLLTPILNYESSPELLPISNTIMTNSSISDTTIFNINKLSNYEKTDWS